MNIVRLTTTIKGFLFASLFASFFTSEASWADSTHIAVAANFAKPMQAIVEAFERHTEHKVIISLGGSGKLFAQIQHGAPYDVFLSADNSKPQALIDANLALMESQFTYAVGALALWHPSQESAKKALENHHYKRLAIANPRLAPYGSAAKACLEKMGYWERAKNSLVMGENISQAYQFVASGNAQLGFVALSQIIHEGEIPAGAWVTPKEYHPPILQDAILLTHGQDNSAAKAFLAFLKTSAAINIINQYGYRNATD